MARTRNTRARALCALSALLIASMAALWLKRAPAPSSDESTGIGTPPAEWPDAPDRISQRERAVDLTSWAAEMLAQRCGATVESWWEAVRSKTNALEIASRLEIGELVLGKWETVRTLPFGVMILESKGEGRTVPESLWAGWVLGWANAGWHLDAIEFRHVGFDTNAAGGPEASRFEFSMHVSRAEPEERAIVVGDLRVHWEPPAEARLPVKARRVDAAGLRILTRNGPPVFRPVNEFELAPPGKIPAIDPLIVHDLDGDGVLELVLPAMNEVYHLDARGLYGATPLLTAPAGEVLAGVLADADGDSHPDLLLASREGLTVFRGRSGGGFENEGRVAWRPMEPLQNPMALAAGDADGDGRIDLFLGQYRVPTLGQVLRPQYYDANDGHPCYLLRNKGESGFEDVTPGSGLEPKRGRRIYSASWVDLDGDADLDLVVVADFAGMDVYQNDGRGRFHDATAQWLGDSHGFGMAHATSDFNADGRLDLLMIGMTSPTADRLEHLGLWRPDARGDRSMRALMTAGNRLYLGQAGGGFATAPQTRSIARSGWSWGVGVLDCDNDGYPDVCIANGYQSQASVRDYESEFWLHDIHVGDDVGDVEATAYFSGKFQSTRGRGWSYGGNEKNRLYWNDGGRGFIEVGHLFGVALEEDSRCVVAADYDGDGRVDLFVTTEEVWPRPRQTLRVYRNALERGGHWIGFRLDGGGGGASSAGAQVTLESGGRRAVQAVSCGDSFRSQRPGIVHFGLGEATRVDSVEIRWPGGRRIRMELPAVDRYHRLEEPGR